MSIIVRGKRYLPSPIVEKAAEAPSTVFRPRYAEAPDAGYRNSEAPEMRSGRHYESSDSGEGRSHLMETNFTHGRSRS